MSCNPPKLPPSATSPAFTRSAPDLAAFGRVFPDLDAFLAYLIESNAVVYLSPDVYQAAVCALLAGQTPDERSFSIPPGRQFRDLVDAWFQEKIVACRGAYDPDDPALLAFINRHYGYYSLRTAPALERAGFIYAKSRRAWKRKGQQKTASTPRKALQIEADQWERIASNPHYFASMAVSGSKIQIVDRRTGRPLCGVNATINSDDWEENAYPLHNNLPPGDICASCLRVALARMSEAQDARDARRKEL